jgi:hypothetical protein
MAKTLLMNPVIPSGVFSSCESHLLVGVGLVRSLACCSVGSGSGGEV